MQHLKRRRRSALVTQHSTRAVSARSSHPTRARLSYRFDTLFSRGTTPLIAWLGVVTLLLIMTAGLVIAMSNVAINGDHDRAADKHAPTVL